MVSLKKMLGAVAAVAVISVVLSGTASAQWFSGGYYGGHHGSSWGFGFGSSCAPVYTPCYPTYTPCYPTYTPCYPVYRRSYRSCW